MGREREREQEKREEMGWETGRWDIRKGRRDGWEGGRMVGEREERKWSWDKSISDREKGDGKNRGMRGETAREWDERGEEHRESGVKKGG